LWSFVFLAAILIFFPRSPASSTYDSIHTDGCRLQFETFNSHIV
jgi:hypothetical protein